MPGVTECTFDEILGKELGLARRRMSCVGRFVVCVYFYSCSLICVRCFIGCGFSVSLASRPTCRKLCVVWVWTATAQVVLTSVLQREEMPASSCFSLST